MVRVTFNTTGRKGVWVQIGFGDDVYKWNLRLQAVTRRDCGATMVRVSCGASVGEAERTGSKAAEAIVR